MTSNAPSSPFSSPAVQAYSFCQSQAHFLLARRRTSGQLQLRRHHNAHTAENSTLDSLTGDSQNFMPPGGRCVGRGIRLHEYIIAPIVRPVTSGGLPSPHVPRLRSQELATTDRHVPAQPPETTPRRLVSCGLTPSTDLDFLSGLSCPFSPLLYIKTSIEYREWPSCSLLCMYPSGSD
ncbi:hypothetical protein F5148DRAFT_540722 [Russula earlei]|uniref:Uncharacterized protein n=1 Tax=Russula earlei TaxID=71964 RepID=A0ACC0UG93_9AGAM|nr:hypothetical protein F5148DRAFT_540722 [Russula earlei]